MIRIKDVTKTFGAIKALDGVSAEISAGSIYGLIGSNGSGKSTLLRIMCGVFLADSGYVEIDGENVYENSKLKQSIVYLSDEQFFLPHSTMNDMAQFYKSVYRSFDMVRFVKLTEVFGLDPNRKIATFSKGMTKQASILLGLSVHPKYMFLDETFDGLDPVVRQLVKRLIAEEVAERKMTPVIASHNLRELEDICDHVGLLHQGGILFDRELDDMKLNIHKLQLVLREETPIDALSPLNILDHSSRGRMHTIVCRGTTEEIDAVILPLEPVYYEIIPLTLEEIFISEMEEKGYDFKNVIF
ncbi:MAG: ABC transporter ATP-binding protein [Clostridiales bacterium]|nr:ABC transporter ATP-binding protein [Clostridiales bacterium]